MELWQRFTSRARRAVLLAQDEASRMNMQLIGTEHLLLGLVRLGEGAAVEVLEALGVDLDRLRVELQRHMEAGSEEASATEMSFTPEAERVLQLAYAEARSLNHNYIGTEHILIGLVREARGAAHRLLRRHGIDLQRVRQAVVGHAQVERAPQERTKSKTPTLDHFSRDLTQLAVEGELDPVVGREEETQRVIQILSRRTKNNPCLIGEPGVGKTAIVEGLAQKIVGRDVPETLTDKRLVALDLAGIVAGTKYRGEFEERMKRIMDEIRAARGRIIVFLDELHTLVGTGAAEGAMDASNILKPALARGELRCIGATTLDEFRKHVEKSPSLERRFMSVMVRQPNRDESVAILHGLRERYEQHHQVTIADEAIESAVDLSERYISDRSLPDKAIDLLDEASARVRLQFARTPAGLRSLSQQLRADRDLGLDEVAAGGDRADTEQHELERRQLREQVDRLGQTFDETRELGEPVVTREDIAEVVSMWTGIPTTSLTEEESGRLLRMEEALHEHVVGQDDAIAAVASAVRRARAGVKDPRRPTGVFIFLGPTGVGKSHLAKYLAIYLFGDEEALIRIDMSEYTEKFSVSRLMGAPPGYVGYEESGQLTEAVRRRPYSVVLLDEIEKAHPEVFNVLLQVMDDGRLTDSQGRVVDFKNTIVIMTGNIGARLIAEDRRHGFTAGATPVTREQSYERMKQKVMDELKKTFRPEFLNRVDDVLVFHALTTEEIREIVDIELRRMQGQLREREIELELGEEVRELLCREGYDPRLGARPLRRAIQRLIEDPVAAVVIARGPTPGGVIAGEVEGDEIKFRYVEVGLPTP